MTFRQFFEYTCRCCGQNTAGHDGAAAMPPDPALAQQYQAARAQHAQDLLNYTHPIERKLVAASMNQRLARQFPGHHKEMLA